NAAGNETNILKKYNAKYMNSLVTAKQAEIDSIQDSIDAKDIEIIALRNILAIENNFTVQQIQERNQFIIEKEWIDQNYIDAKDLYNDAQVKFEQLKNPQTV